MSNITLGPNAEVEIDEQTGELVIKTQADNVTFEQSDVTIDGGLSASDFATNTISSNVNHQGNDINNVGALSTEEAVIQYGGTIGINAAYFGELSDDDSGSNSVNALAGETGIETVIVPEGEYQLTSRFNDFDNISWIIGMGDGSVIKPHDGTDEDSTEISSHTHLAGLNFVAEPDSTERPFRVDDTNGEWPLEDERRIVRDCRFEAEDRPLAINTERIVATGISAIADEGNDAVRFDPGAADCIIDNSILNGSITISGSAGNIVQGDNIIL